MRLVFLVFISIITSTLFAQAPPFEGDDLFQLIGKRKTNGIIAKMSLYLGAKPDEKGVRITILDNICTRVDLYNDDNPWGEQIQAFTGKLPMGVSFADNIPQTKQKVGSGFKAEGDVFDNYYITKPFQLDSKDTCLITLEFIKGRLTTVSMAFIKTISDNPEENPGYVEPALYGEDLLIMVKKNEHNFEYRKLTTYLGHPSFMDRYTRVYAEGGVEVRFNKSRQIDWIYLFSGGVSGSGGQNMSKYQLPLPFGVVFGESKASVTSKSGAPHGTEGNSIYYNEGYARVYLQFLGSGLSIVRVGVNPDFSITPPPTKKQNTNY